MIGYEWQFPVYDRDANDIAEAYRYITEMKSGRVKNAVDMKGCINASDLNRVENDLLILAKALSIDIIAKEWSADFKNQPTVDDKARILSNASIIRSEVISRYSQDLPALPTDLMTYTDFNTIERVIDLASDFMFHPLRTANNDRLVIADFVTPLTVDVYASSGTNLNGSMVIDEETYESIQHDSDTHYIVVGVNEVKEYIGSDIIGRRESNG